MENVSQEVLQMIHESVDHILFERGWIDQTPHEFVVLVEEDIFKPLSQLEIAPPRNQIKTLIMDTLKKKLGDEYDVNLFRLKFFPSERHQRFDA